MSPEEYFAADVTRILSDLHRTALDKSTSEQVETEQAAIHVLKARHIEIIWDELASNNLAENR